MIDGEKLKEYDRIFRRIYSSYAVSGPLQVSGQGMSWYVLTKTGKGVMDWQCRMTLKPEDETMTAKQLEAKLIMEML